MEWRLYAARVELQAIKKKQRVKFASLFSRGPRFLFLSKKKNGKNASRTRLRNQTHTTVIILGGAGATLVTVL